PAWIVSTWYGLWAIKGTPEPIVKRMYDEVVKALKSPKLQAIWKEQLAQTGGESQAEFAKRIRTEIEKWQKVVNAAGVKLD
ncbi:MAG: tripartite tricarboxylate transporter substrate binding protein, partial [Reyranella sp.]